MSNNLLSTKLKRMLSEGSSFIELVDFVHQEQSVQPYERYVIIKPFREAFSLSLLDISQIVFACRIFGGCSSIQETERLFMNRVRKKTKDNEFE